MMPTLKLKLKQEDKTTPGQPRVKLVASIGLKVPHGWGCQFEAR